MIGKTDKQPVSHYQPSREVQELTAYVKKDYDQGVRIINKPYIELNDRSVIQDENRGQLMFNAYVDVSVEDPSEEWKWRGTRSMARNKGIAMHAQLTANYLLPLFIAQNDDDEVDRGFSEIMQDIVEWMAQPTNSTYQQSFLQMVFGMETNPVTFMGAEYCEVMQTIKTKTESGDYSTEDILDEVLSGFNAPVYSSSQVLINNAYERSMQKQKCIIERRYTTYEELEAKYGEHENWEYVQAGIKSVYSEEEGLFYDVKDDDDYKDLVAEEIYKSRREDTEIPFINGIYMGESNTEANAIRHRDARNAPKYNKVPFGFSRIGEHFFYYKSMMNQMGWDNMLYDAMSEITMNRALLETEMPIAISGGDKIDSEVIFPNSVVSFEDPATRISPLIPQSNTPLAFNALRETEKALEDDSVSSTMSGQLPEASQKAYSVAQARADAKKLIGGTMKVMADSMIQYGDLMKDIVLNHITVPQVDMLTGDTTKLKYRSFFLENKQSGGKMGERSIKFDESLIGNEMTEIQKMEYQMKLLEESGYPDKKKSMAVVNPHLFAKFKYLTKIDLEAMFTKSSEYMQPILMALDAQMANNPFSNREELTKEIYYTVFQSEGDRFMKKPEEVQPEGEGAKGMAASAGAQAQNRMQNQQVNTAAKVIT
jgi:hypothetical protein